MGREQVNGVSRVNSEIDNGNGKRRGEGKMRRI